MEDTYQYIGKHVFYGLSYLHEKLANNACSVKGATAPSGVNNGQKKWSVEATDGCYFFFPDEADESDFVTVFSEVIRASP